MQQQYTDVIMGAMSSQITGVSVVCLAGCSDADHSKQQQSSASLASVRGIYRWPVNTPPTPTPHPHPHLHPTKG